MCVLVGFAKQTFIPYKETFGVNFLQGRVIRIDTETQTVVLDNGKVSHTAMLQQKKTECEKMSLYSMCQFKSTGSTLFTPHSVHWNKWTFPRQTQLCRHLPISHSEVWRLCQIGEFSYCLYVWYDLKWQLQTKLWKSFWVLHYVHYLS